MQVQKFNSALLLVLVIIAIGGVFHLTSSLLIPMVIALLLTFVFTPFVDFLTKHKIPRVLSAFIVIIILLGLLFFIGWFLYSSFNSLLREFPKYQRRFMQILALGIETVGLPEDTLTQIDWFRTISSSLLSFTEGFMSLMGAVVLMLVFLFFLLIEKPYLRGKMEQAFRGGPTTKKIIVILRHINDQIGHYLTIKLVISFVTGLLVWGTFALIGLDFAFIWGALAFVFNFIPNIGSIAIGIISILFSVIQFFPAWDRIVLVAVAMLSIQLVMGNFLDPKLQGDRLNLSPVVILFSLFLWGWIWGVAGMFLAVPLTVAIKIAFENIPGMKAVGIMMGTGNLRGFFRKRKVAQNDSKKADIDG
jgi:predicted PurR-regulated permease PerM